MIYRIHKPHSGYILFYASPEPLSSIIQRYPDSTVTESSLTELKAFQALAGRSYYNLTAPPKDLNRNRKRHRKPVFTTKPARR